MVAVVRLISSAPANRLTALIMNMPIDGNLALLIYKLVCITSGVFFCFLGYRLFVLGILGTAGDLDSQFKNTKLILKKAAPGTFFALFGAVIIAGTVFQGFTIPAPGSKGTIHGLGPEAQSETAADLVATRAVASQMISDLNNLPKLFTTEVSPQKQLDIKRAIRVGKREIVVSVWSTDWGDVRRFRNWVNEGESEPVPADLKDPVKLFQQGK